MAASSAPIIDSSTIASLLAFLSIVIVSYVASQTLLPANSSSRARGFFAWHLFDALIHMLLEGAFLWNCFTVFIQLPGPPSYVSSTHTIVTPPGVFFLNQPTRLYGAVYGDSPAAKFWHEYTKADKRWGGADLTIISLELLTVLVCGPLSLYIAELYRRGHGDEVSVASGKKRISGKAAFWMIVLATSELYGGFMTFSPEWLSGGPNLDTSNAYYLWFYLVFFNLIWVFVPIYAMYAAYSAMTESSVIVLEKKKK